MSETAIASDRVPLVANESTSDNYGIASIAVENNPENVEPGTGVGEKKGRKRRRSGKA